MQYPAAFSFSSVYSLGFLPCAGLRLWALRQFQAFLAFSARPACASSFYFRSTARLCSIFGLAVVANRSVKPTRLRRAAYFRSLATDGQPHMNIEKIKNRLHAILIISGAISYCVAIAIFPWLILWYIFFGR